MIRAYECFYDVFVVLFHELGLASLFVAPLMITLYLSGECLGLVISISAGSRHLFALLWYIRFGCMVRFGCGPRA